MTPTQLATCAAADTVINAPAEHLALEPKDCLIEIIDVCLEHLSEFHGVGVGWRVIQMTLLRDRVEKTPCLSQSTLL